MLPKFDHSMPYHSLKDACLLTDFYQFTMAQAYFSEARQNIKAVFHLFFRKNPFRGNWALAAGIHDAISFIARYNIDDESLNYLSTLRTEQGNPFFTDQFLRFLSEVKPEITVHGVEDGDVVFPFEPILRVSGPLFLCQLLETPILNIVNFQTLIATKAARIVRAANSKIVMDFGLRRAQGFDGALSATRASYIGGIHATSNVWAGKHFQIPISGTQGHSFVMSYEKQLDAFNDFAKTFKDQCVLVVDTFDTVSGISDAIEIYRRLVKEGHKPLGIRLDSGDLLEESRYARASLNRAGLAHCKIIASGDLDECIIGRLEELKAPIDIYGVGTKLVTAYDDPALGGVFKLAAIEEAGFVRHTHKISGTTGKRSLPGPQTIFRRFQDGLMISDRLASPSNEPEAVGEKELHVLLMDNGHIVKAAEDLGNMRVKAKASIESLPMTLKESKDFLYPVYFDGSLIMH